MRVEKVSVYDVNGFLVCEKGEGELDKYLEDVPSFYIQNKDYLGERFVLAVGKEFTTHKCKELRHMKINELYHTEDLALNKVV